MACVNPNEIMTPIADEFAPARVVASETMYEGLVWDVRRDSVDLGHEVVQRDLVDHPGAVAVIALDEEDRLVLIQQYRHPIRMREWEVPAGLLDVTDEPALLAAQRELAEEADLHADSWAVLLDYATSPGFTNETIRIFLARGIRPVPEEERHERTGEERDMPVRWVSLDEARDAVLAGRLHNPHTVIAILAAHAMRERGWRDLRPADEPWALRQALRDAASRAGSA